jgi:hypothetical protein
MAVPTATIVTLRSGQIIPTLPPLLQRSPAGPDRAE